MANMLTHRLNFLLQVIVQPIPKSPSKRSLLVKGSEDNIYIECWEPSMPGIANPILKIPIEVLANKLAYPCLYLLRNELHNT